TPRLSGLARRRTPWLRCQGVLPGRSGEPEGAAGEVLTRGVSALLAAGAALLASGGAAGFELPAKPAARVNDYAGVLSADAERTTGERLAAYERETSNQIVVAAIPSLGGAAIEDVAVRTFERWGLGQKGTNNGVLLLIAVGDHRARIEVGYGLEDRLTDALSRRI